MSSVSCACAFASACVLGMIEVLVVDAGPFIKGAQLEKWSRQVVTTRDVCAEIRDKATRERLQVLPYDLSVREPTVESIRHGRTLFSGVTVQVCITPPYISDGVCQENGRLRSSLVRGPEALVPHIPTAL